MTDLFPRAILWRRLDVPGHDSCRVTFDGHSALLTGTALFLYERQPTRLNYRVTCDAGWRTRHAQIEGWCGAEAVSVDIGLDAGGHWWLNGEHHPKTDGCVDLDLDFTPATNLLPIRRLGLAVGQSAQVKAAWLGFPELSLTPLAQHYASLNPVSYRYEVADPPFQTILQLDDTGLITDYPGFWQAEG